jgi:hypothetical protein
MLWQLVGGLFLFGIWGNMINISVNTQAVGVESLYRRSIMASFHGVWSLAGFTGAGIGTLMVSAGIAPVAHFIVIAATMLLLVLLAHRFTLTVDKGNNGGQ